MFWRNRDDPDAPDIPGQNDSGAAVENAPQETDSTQPEQKQTTSSFFFWSRTVQEDEGNKDEVPETAISDSEPPQASKLWFTFFSSDETPQTQEQPEQAQEEPKKASTSSWFWPFGSTPAEPESDTEDAENTELFRSARAALEASRGNAHYAILYERGELVAHLAVCGHETESSPVPFSVKKRPVLPNELIEASLVSARARQKAQEEQVAKEAEIKAQEVERRAHEDETKAKEEADKKEQKSEGNGKAKPEKAKKGQEAESGSKEANSASKAATLPKSAKPSLPKLGLPIQESTKTMAPESNASASTTTPNKTASEAKPTTNSQLQALVLPHMHHNFREITFVTKARLLGEKFIKGDQTSERHLYLSTAGSINAKKRKRTRNAVVISMHSLLPPKFVRNYIAQSTGSAKQFGLKAMEAVAKWLQESDNSEQYKTDISAVCLEGQGTITDRVRESFRLLRNWRHEINSADLIFFVSSSMATPAAITLLSAMHQSEEFNLHRKKIGMLSMAGIHCGPYPGLNARVVTRAYYPAENEIIKELFELQKTSSQTSKQLSADTKYLCEHNVKMTLVGALDDQFVPLFSSVDSLVSHPNIFKCIYIDEQCCVPAFIVKLFLVILMMQNVGYSDQNMITDLSERLQGPVNVNNGSHGRIYDNEDVYDMGVRFTMETTSLVQSRTLRFEKPGAGVGPARKPHERSKSGVDGSVTPKSPSQKTGIPTSPTNSATALVTPRGVPGESSIGEVWQSDKNLYHLPWNVRGVVNDLLTIKHIENVLLLMELAEEYKKWEPTKAWREMKFCFAAFEEVMLDELML